MTDDNQAATRLEHDSLGVIEVPSARLWGAQTQRSLRHFRISNETMPQEMIQALALVKRCAATVNGELVRAIGEPFTVPQHHCQVGLTVGYAIAPNDANGTRVLLKRADAAMYAGKQSGKNCARRAAPADNLI